MPHVHAPTAATLADVSNALTSARPALATCGSSYNTEHGCATVHDPDTLAALLASDPSRAATLIARLTLAQRLLHALAHVCWCEQQGQTCHLAEVLADWEHTVLSNAVGPETASPTPHATLASYLAYDPLDAAILLLALPLPERIAAAHAHASWLSAHGLFRTAADILDGWQALVDQAETLRQHIPALSPSPERRMP